MSERARAVIFDMDGLLVDSEPVYRAAWQAAAMELGHDLSDAFYDSLTGRTEADAEHALMASFGDAFPLDRFRARWNAQFRDAVAVRALPAKPGAMDLLQCLRQHAIPTALATSSTRDFMELTLASARIDPSFDAVVTGELVERGKPAPDIFLEAARRLGIEPTHCIVLEDSRAGTDAALAARMSVVIVPDLATVSAPQRAAAAGVFDDLFLARPTLLRLLGIESNV